MHAIVFVLRGCSANWLGAYGNEWIATPNLDRIAAEGIAFDRHFSDCPDPAAACRTWLRGRSETSAPTDFSLLDALRSAQVPTVLVRANHPDTDAPDWYYAGWGEVFDVRPQEEDRLSLDSLVRALPGLLERLLAAPRFLVWIEIDSLLPPWRIRQDVFHAYVEDTEETDPYEEESDAAEDEDDEEEEAETTERELDDEVLVGPTPEEVTPWADPPTGPFDLRDTIACEWLHWSLAALVTGLDAELGVVFDQLRAKGLDRTAAWLLTSDFGYPLGEHGQIGRHRPWLYEELVHLPLLLRLPEGEEACRRVSGFTQPQNLAPTLLDLLGVPFQDSNRSGKSLVPAAHGRGDTGRDCSVSQLRLGEAAELAIRTDEWALLVPTDVPKGESREPQLFSKPDDHWEVNDLRARNIEQADALEERLRKCV